MTFLKNADELADFVEQFFGHRTEVLTVSPSTGRVNFVLYDAFVFSTTIDPQTRAFGLGVLLAQNFSPSRMLGEDVSLNNEEVAIASALTLADRYCRLRLPDKYLSEFEASRS